MTELQRRFSILLLILVAFCAAYPEDFDQFISSASSFLGLTFAVSPWLYGLMGIGMIVQSIHTIWKIIENAERSHHSP